MCQSQTKTLPMVEQSIDFQTSKSCMWRFSWTLFISKFEYVLVSMTCEDIGQLSSDLTSPDNGISIMISASMHKQYLLYIKKLNQF